MKTGEALWQWYKDAADIHSDWKDEAKELYNLRVGRQWSEEELAFLEENLRSAVTFNRTGPLIDAAVGHQIYNRQQIQYLPREIGDVAVHEVLTGAVKWIDDESDADTEVSDAFEDCLICGLGWTESRIDYDSDPDGQPIGAERINPLDMEWDPSAEKRNLTDARYFMRGKWFAREIAEEIWPKIKDLELESSHEVGDLSPHHVDAKDRYREQKTGDHAYYRKHLDEVYVLQAQYYEMDEAYAVRTLFGQAEFSAEKYNKIKGGVGVELLGKRKKKQWKQAFFVGPEILEDGPAPSPNHPSLIPITGKRDTIKNEWFGICRSVRDPQKWANKFFSDTMDIVSKNRRGGAFVETDAFDDPRQAEEKWNDPAGLVMLTPGALAAGKIQERSPVAYPAGMDRLMEFAIRAIPDVTGMNQEMMGLVARNQPGILEQQRKQAALTILGGFFDSLRQHGKLRGRVLAYYVQHYLSDGRLVRLLGNNGSEQFIPLTKDKLTMKYDIVVDQAPMSTNTREQVFFVLRELLPIFQALGVSPTPEMLDYLPLPKSLVDKMKQSLSNPAQAQAAQEARAMQMEKTKSEIEHQASLSEKARTDAALAPYKVSIDATKA